VDYEFRIKVAERELAHLREMQALTQAHLDAHDKSFNAVEARFERIDAYLEKIAQAQVRTEANLVVLTDRLTDLSQKFNGLIDALTREHGNGRS
jgi:chromosome segregation ATPase